MRKNILVLLTAQFPYANEPFIAAEVNYYKEFDKVFCIPTVVKYHGISEILPESITLYKINPNIKSSKNLFFCKAVLDECLELTKTKHFSIKRLNILLDCYSRAEIYAINIYQMLTKHGITSNDNITFYSYWMDVAALTCVLLQNKFSSAKSISRCHGFDLYEKVNKDGYLPFRKYLLNHLSHTYPISYDGKRYLEEKYHVQNAKIAVRHLGTIRKNGSFDYFSSGDRKILKVVSCSNIIPLKRVDKIVEVLGRIKDIPIEWTHYGDGIHKLKIIRMCKEILGSNVSYSLKGQIRNEQILKDYQTYEYHVFLHMSTSEGIPFSFMEAMSYGIPVISTNVGGIPEIVKDGISGFLMDENVKTEKAAGILRTIYNMEEDKYKTLRKTTQNIWNKYYNGEINYKNFVLELLK